MLKARWVKVLSKEFPTLAFHASVTNPFGKGALIQLLRQFGQLHRDRQQICVGFIGYPNVGKSSIINTLRGKKVVNVAPIPGETKVWQYITLMRRIFLIDCPGVVSPSSKDTETEIVLKGVVRVENLKAADAHIQAVLDRVKKEYIHKTYSVNEWKDSEDFLKQLAVRSGRLLKGGDPDTDSVAKVVLNDWQRGKIPFFVPPPFDDAKEAEVRKKALEQLDEEVAEAKDAQEDEQKDEEEEEEEEEDVKIGVKQRFAEIKVKGVYQNELNPVSDDEEDESEEAIDWDRVYESVQGDDLLDEGKINVGFAFAFAFAFAFVC